MQFKAIHTKKDYEDALALLDQRPSRGKRASGTRDASAEHPTLTVAAEKKAKAWPKTWGKSAAKRK